MAEHRGPAVSVVIVNYKVAGNLAQTLHSLQDSDGGEAVEIIVVDNASADGSQEFISARFPDVTWIQLKQNIGFGKACNVGAKTASGDYLLFLNPDTIVTKTTLSATLAFMRQHPEAGMVGPKVLNPAGFLQALVQAGVPHACGGILPFFRAEQVIS